MIITVACKPEDFCKNAKGSFDIAAWLEDVAPSK